MRKIYSEVLKYGNSKVEKLTPLQVAQLREFAQAERNRVMSLVNDLSAANPDKEPGYFESKVTGYRDSEYVLSLLDYEDWLNDRYNELTGVNPGLNPQVTRDQTKACDMAIDMYFESLKTEWNNKPSATDKSRISEEISRLEKIIKESGEEYYSVIDGLLNYSNITGSQYKSIIGKYENFKKGDIIYSLQNINENIRISGLYRFMQYLKGFAPADPIKRIDTNIKEWSGYASTIDVIQKFGVYIVNDMKVYTPEMVWILTEFSGTEYMDSYTEGYKEGVEYWNDNFAISRDVLYGANGQKYITDLLNNYNKIEHTGGFKEGWKFVKKQYPTTVSHKTIKEYGYYSGIVCMTDEFMKKYSSVFEGFAQGVEPFDYTPFTGKYTKEQVIEIFTRASKFIPELPTAGQRVRWKGDKRKLSTFVRLLTGTTQPPKWIKTYFDPGGEFTCHNQTPTTNKPQPVIKKLFQ